MKPIHHALVSARLFGGVPEDYVAVHNAFDLSKAALADMRHRAALHSVDHGLSVMRLIFPDQVGATSLEEICIQHINDDQGFSATLDTWLGECPLPAWSAATICPKPVLRPFLDDPEEACARMWGGEPEDYAAICAYYRLPEAVSDHPMAPAISRNAFGIYYSEKAFGPAITVMLKSGKPKYVPVRNVGETLALARYGRIMTLADVLETMPCKDWMLGSRVARSRSRRIAASGMPDLFSEDSVGSSGHDAAYVDEAAFKAILSD